MADTLFALAGDIDRAVGLGKFIETTGGGSGAASAASSLSSAGAGAAAAWRGFLTAATAPAAQEAVLTLASVEGA